MLDQLPPGIGLLSTILLGVLAGVIALLVWRQVRDRRQIAALLERLERLEVDRPPAVEPGSGAGSEPPEPAGAAPAVPPPIVDAGAFNPSGDVLHGRTTHVQRLLDGSGGAASSLADQAIYRIHAHIEENLTPHQLAWELCVSLRTLERGLGMTLTCTPRQLILAMKMREARRMLTAGRRVNEVASRLGFSNPFHFSRRFKEFYHVAPSEMRPGPPAGR